MGNASNEQSAGSLFGDVISTYSRVQAIEDGVLIDAGSIANEIGFRWPVALTSAAWADCVVWTDVDSRQQVHQDQSGRLYDVLYMAAHAIRTSKQPGDRLLFQLYRVPRDGHSTEAVLVTLKLIVGPGDTTEPVITILLPRED
jgi:hypothetical protein